MSTQTAAPFINFGDRVREALEFYHGVLGGKLELYTVTDGAPKAAGPEDHVTFGRLDADEVHIVAGGGTPGQTRSVGNHMGVYLTVGDDARLVEVFDGLAEGGTVDTPLSPRPWGRSGALTDKLGITWAVSKGR